MFVSFSARVHRDESGIAMIIAVTLSAVVATLAVLMLSVGTHSDKATARGRHWVQALHVAESGVEQAIAKIQEAVGNIGSPAVSFSGDTDEGEYEVTISKGSRNRYTIEATGGVRAGRQLGAERTLRVTMEPPRSFTNALLSYTAVETKNNDIIEGDIWANNNVILASDTRVTGSITAATGYIQMRQRAHVEEDAWSGGFESAGQNAILLEANATIDGDAKASVSAPPDPISCGGASPDDYGVRLEAGAQIFGDLTTWGAKNGAGLVGPPGELTEHSCTGAAATVPLPTFTYAAANYPSATLHEYGTPSTPSATAVTDFQNYVSSQTNKRISGTFYINQAAPVNQDVRVDLTDVIITGDTTIVTNTPIFTNDTTDDATDAVVILVSTYRPPVGTSCDVNQDHSECSAHIKNNFSTSGSTAVLVYTPYGPTTVKNNAEQFGAIYADSIQIKNNQTLTYDARVEQVVGFGDVTLVVTKWQEVTG